MLESLPHYVPTITNTQASSIVRNNNKLLDHTICCCLLTLFVYSQVLELRWWKVFPFFFILPSKWKHFEDFSSLKFSKEAILLSCCWLEADSSRSRLINLADVLKFWRYSSSPLTRPTKKMELSTFYSFYSWNFQSVHCSSAILFVIRLLYFIKCKKKKKNPNNDAISALHCISRQSVPLIDRWKRGRGGGLLFEGRGNSCRAPILSCLPLAAR